MYTSIDVVFKPFKIEKTNNERCWFFFCVWQSVKKKLMPDFDNSCPEFFYFIEPIISQGFLSVDIPILALASA